MLIFFKHFFSWLYETYNGKNALKQVMRENLYTGHYVISKLNREAVKTLTDPQYPNFHSNTVAIHIPNNTYKLRSDLQKNPSLSTYYLQYLTPVTAEKTHFVIACAHTTFATIAIKPTFIFGDLTSQIINDLQQQHIPTIHFALLDFTKNLDPTQLTVIGKYVEHLTNNFSPYNIREITILLNTTLSDPQNNIPTIIHEIEHIIGLRHPYGGYDVVFKRPDIDKVSNTIMSYKNPDNIIFAATPRPTDVESACMIYKERCAFLTNSTYIVSIKDNALNISCYPQESNKLFSSLLVSKNNPYFVPSITMLPGNITSFKIKTEIWSEIRLIKSATSIPQIHYNAYDKNLSSKRAEVFIDSACKTKLNAPIQINAGSYITIYAYQNSTEKFNGPLPIEIKACSLNLLIEAGNNLLFSGKFNCKNPTLSMKFSDPVFPQQCVKQIQGPNNQICFADHFNRSISVCFSGLLGETAKHSEIECGNQTDSLPQDVGNICEEDNSQTPKQPRMEIIYSTRKQIFRVIC